MTESITVHVVKYGNRKNLVMRCLCPLTNKEVVRSAGTPRQRESEKAAAKWEAELREGRYQRRGRMAWEEFKDRYLLQATREKSAGTVEKAESMFRVVESVIRPATIGDIRKESLALLKQELLATRATTTVHGYLAHLRAAMSAAVEWGAIDTVPPFPKVRTAKGAKLMKGRPITGEEFDRMLAAVIKVMPEHAVPSWQFLLRGLWAFELRIGEACDLYWTGSKGHVLDLSGRYPMLAIRGELEKGKGDRILPIAPEFARLLESVPPEGRAGRVFAPRPKRAKGATPQLQRVKTIIARIGEAAGIVVDADPRTGVAKKFASAHNLRRAFGLRWAHRAPTATLMELMRHESIETTKKFYVGENADVTAAVIWRAAEAEEAAIGRLGTISGISQGSRESQTL